MASLKNIISSELKQLINTNNYHTFSFEQQSSQYGFGINLKVWDIFWCDKASIFITDEMIVYGGTELTICDPECFNIIYKLMKKDELTRK